MARSIQCCATPVLCRQFSRVACHREMSIALHSNTRNTHTRATQSSANKACYHIVCRDATHSMLTDTHLQTVSLQAIFFDRLQNCPASRRAHWVPAKSVEVQPPRHGLCNLLCCHNSSQGQAIANALCHGDNVRNDALVLKAPELGACSAETSLHLVGNADTAGCPHVLHHSRLIMNNNNNNNNNNNAFQLMMS